MTELTTNDIKRAIQAIASNRLPDIGLQRYTTHIKNTIQTIPKAEIAPEQSPHGEWVRYTDVIHRRPTPRTTTQPTPSRMPRCQTLANRPTRPHTLQIPNPTRTTGTARNSHKRMNHKTENQPPEDPPLHAGDIQAVHRILDKLKIVYIDTTQQLHAEKDKNKVYKQLLNTEIDKTKIYRQLLIHILETTNDPHLKDKIHETVLESLSTIQVHKTNQPQ